MDLEKKYLKPTEDILAKLKSDKSVPSVLSEIFFTILPQMIRDAKKNETINEEEKKKLVISALKSLISLAFKGLEAIPETQGIGQLETELETLLKDFIEEMAPALVDILFSAEKNPSKKINSCFPCKRK